jgi:hypothetical protein
LIEDEANHEVKLIGKKLLTAGKMRAFFVPLKIP